VDGPALRDHAQSTEEKESTSAEAKGQIVKPPEIPKFLAHLPVYQGLPIPFMVAVSPAGVPLFRVIDKDKWHDCAMEKLCAICGHKLGTRFFFIGGDGCRKSHLFADPPMHEKCAIFSAQACPFIAGDREFSRAPVPAVPGVAVYEVDVASAKRPEKMWLMKTRAYQLVNFLGEPLVQAAKWDVVRELIAATNMRQTEKGETLNP
jgi:hypothetical protein